MSDDLKLALTEIQKRALFKLAVDLVKADKQIHRDEVIKKSIGKDPERGRIRKQKNDYKGT